MKKFLEHLILVRSKRIDQIKKIHHLHNLNASYSVHFDSIELRTSFVFTKKRKNI